MTVPILALAGTMALWALFIYLAAWRGYRIGFVRGGRDQGQHACTLFDECVRLRQELSLAEEGLANYAQEIEAAKHDIERLTKAASAEATEVERLKRDIQELTCGDPRRVCPNCRPSFEHPTAEPMK